MKRVIEESAVSDVVNFAARTDVDQIERERPSGTTRDPAKSSAYAVNAIAPGKMAESAKALGKRFVQISTDFVFDGRSGPYAETALPSEYSPAVSWYGWTKAEGETRVRAADATAVIIRISYPYRAQWESKTDLARWILESFARGTLPPMYSDQQVTPTWIPDVSEAVSQVISRRSEGTLHVASPTITTPHEFAVALIEARTGVREAVRAGSLGERMKTPGYAARPLKGGLRVGRLAELGVRATSWADGARLVAGGESLP